MSISIFVPSEFCATVVRWERSLFLPTACLHSSTTTLGWGRALASARSAFRWKSACSSRSDIDGVFGVFDDSLPDGWGRLLVDRLLRSHGIDPFAVSPIARLAIVGSNGMGALEYVPEIPLTSPATSTDFDELAQECANVLAADGSQDLDTLFAMGGSSGGARPKVLISIDGEDWIVKFASSQDDRDIGESEYRYALAAKACGIDMPEVRLFPSKRCSGYFGVRRFDRVPDASGVARKVHMVSAGATWTTRLSCASRSS